MLAKHLVREIKSQGQITYKRLALSWHKQRLAEISERAKGQRLPHNYIILIQSKYWRGNGSCGGSCAKNSEVTSEK